MIYFGDPHTDGVVIWHLGDPLPAVADRRVVDLQADGDELAVILAALRIARIVGSSANIGRMNCPACDRMPCRCERPANTGGSDARR